MGSDDNDLDNGVESEEAKKPSEQILRQELAEANQALGRSLPRLGCSGLSAGLDLGFSLLLVAIFHSLAAGNWTEPAMRLLEANFYSFGFILVVLGRSELFTEQTSLAVLPLLNRDTTIGRVGRLWLTVYLTNLVGATVFAAFLVLVGPALGILTREVLGEIGTRVVDHSWWVIFLSAVLAGWLMGMLSWLVAAGRDTISQLVLVWLVTFAIGFGHLHHCILGTIEVLAGVFSGTGPSLVDFAHFLLFATLGNAVGGPLFVALLKYGHAKEEE